MNLVMRALLVLGVVLFVVGAAWLVLDRYLEPTIEEHIRDRIMGKLVEQGAIPGGEIEIFCPAQGCDE